MALMRSDANEKDDAGHFVEPKSMGDTSSERSAGGLCAAQFSGLAVAVLLQHVGLGGVHLLSGPREVARSGGFASVLSRQGGG